jgi:hypothetical protein
MLEKGIIPQFPVLSQISSADRCIKSKGFDDLRGLTLTGRDLTSIFIENWQSYVMYSFKQSNKCTFMFRYKTAATSVKRELQGLIKYDF